MAKTKKSIIERVSCLDDVFKIAGKERKGMSLKDQCAVIEDVMNEGKKVTFLDGYYPFHRVIRDKEAPRGFRLVCCVYDCAYGWTDSGARPYFADPKVAAHFGRIAADDFYPDLITWTE